MEILGRDVELCEDAADEAERRVLHRRPVHRSEFLRFEGEWERAAMVGHSNPSSSSQLEQVYCFHESAPYTAEARSKTLDPRTEVAVRRNT